MMVLADTSVWIDHFRRGEPELMERLRLGEIVIHSAVISDPLEGPAPQGQ